MTKFTEKTEEEMKNPELWNNYKNKKKKRK
jgi:hypothetical protein